jgi:hypothetical protein
VSAPSPGELDLGLDATLADPAALTVTLTLTNRTDQPLNPGLFASQLLIDGTPWINWRLALNGTVDPRLVQLPPHDTATLTRNLDATTLPTGPHQLVLQINGQETAPVTVTR